MVAVAKASVPKAKGGAAKGTKFVLRQKDRRATQLRKNARKETTVKLRKSITPGTVVILLSSGYRGKRVVVLKQMRPSGLLLVSGPFKVNGVPLRRVNQRYVIATSTKVDVSKVTGLDAIEDSMFKRSTKDRISDRKNKSSDDSSMFVQQGEKSKQALPQAKRDLQDKIDAQLLVAVNKDKVLTQYLKTRFTLRSNMAIHNMKF